MTVDDFRPFYQAIHGYPPFDWQEQLVRRVSAEGWPASIALPTSSGKTSAIDVAVFHLALEAGLKVAERSAALRIFFVIDRRVVVDEASEHAMTIARALFTFRDGPVSEAAQRLRKYGGELPLEVSTMRGGMYRDNSWADEPNQPLVCVSTVDQAGSRLLFRGYQVGDSSRPVHAGLVGNDSLIIVDEAHLSRAFLHTVKAVRDRYGNWAAQPPAKPFRLVEMSATIDEAGTFRPDSASLGKDVLLADRLNASKPADLRIPKNKFEDEMVAAAKELATNPNVRVVGIIANTVGSARDIFTQLRKTKGVDTVLLIGRNRPYCAQKLWDKYKPRIAAKYGREQGDLLFVVATQTVEVGANIDFDALVTESAPLDALRQRFGRLNRLGKPGIAKAVIVRRPKDDPVYGHATQRTWDFLTEHAPVDFGVAAIEPLLRGADLVNLNSESSPGPLLFPAHLESWVQTNPSPSPDPDVAPFLHGYQALEAADVQVVWRADLDGVDPKEWGQIVQLAPPVATEALPLPIAAVTRWLKNQRQEIADVEGVAPEAKEEKTEKGRPILRWRGVDKNKQGFAGDIRPGDTIVVPASYGGADDYGWNPDAGTSTDIGDEANNDQAKLGIRRPRLRLNLVADIDREKLIELIGRLRGSGDEGPDPEARGEICRLLRVEFEGPFRIERTETVITWPLQKRPRSEFSPVTEETDEDDDSSFIGRQIPLTSHTAGVVKCARRYAEGCGLARELIDDIALAARGHDLGKCDERFQNWLYGGPSAGREIIAKSGERRTRAEQLQLRQSAGYPRGARHEAASVMAAGALNLLAHAYDPELVLHLIGAHHGNGRPFLPVWDESPDYRLLAECDGATAEVTSGHELARLDSGWVDRFWDLNRKYGYWGLAYLEGILRRADCMRSRWEERDASD
jgi:CRISPR-associated endonuclease/helicase Cas3